MSQLIPFEFESKSVRVVIDEKGEPWFVGKDVCDALGYKDATTAMRSHCKGVQKLHPLLTAGGVQELRVLTEPDVLRLIVGSSLPAAEAFERLVFEEILPTIRRTGSYTVKPKQSNPVTQNIEANRIFKSNHAVAKLLFKGNQALLSANQATLKATGIDVLANLDATHLLAEKRDVLLTPSDIGKQLGISPAKVNIMLEEKGFQQGYRDSKDKKHWKPTAKGEGYSQTLDTGKRHGNGTPVQQIKWYESVVPFLQ